MFITNNVIFKDISAKEKNPNPNTYFLFYNISIYLSMYLKKKRMRIILLEFENGVYVFFISLHLTYKKVYFFFLLHFA